MQILTVDIGTGTQDILLFDSERAPENCLKLVMPSPTLLISGRIQRATAARQPLLITGVIMGGGPCSWAVEDHRRAGLRVLATADAARTFNDDLDRVERELGVEIIAEETGRRLARGGDYAHIEFRDFDYDAISAAFAAFGVDVAAGCPGVGRLRPWRGAAGRQRSAVPHGLPGRPAARRPAFERTGLPQRGCAGDHDPAARARRHGDGAERAAGDRDGHRAGGRAGRAG